MQWVRKQGSTTTTTTSRHETPSGPSPPTSVPDETSPLPQTQQQLQWQQIQEEKQKRKSQASPPRHPPKSPPRPSTLSSPQHPTSQEGERDAATRPPHSPATSPVEQKSIPPPPLPFFPNPRVEVGRFEMAGSTFDSSSPFQPAHGRKESIDSMASTAAVKNHPPYSGPLTAHIVTEVEERDGGQDGGSQTLTDQESDAQVEEKQSPLTASLGLPTESRHKRNLPKRSHSEYTKKPAALHLEPLLSIATDDTSIPNSPSFYTQNPPISHAKEHDPQSALFKQHLTSLSKSGRQALVESWMQGAHPFWEPPRSLPPPHHHAALPPIPMAIDESANRPTKLYRRKEHVYEDPDRVMSLPSSPTSPPPAGHGSLQAQLHPSGAAPEEVAEIAPYAVVNKPARKPPQLTFTTFATDV